MVETLQDDDGIKRRDITYIHAHLFEYCFFCSFYIDVYRNSHYGYSAKVAVSKSLKYLN